MSMQAINEEELQAYIMPKLKEAVQYIMDKILEENRAQVQKVVYDAYSPVMYIRTYDLLDSWKSTVDTQANHISAKFEYDESQIKAVSLYTNELVPYLADIVYNGLAGDIFGEGPWTKKRDAWKALQHIVGANKIRDWMKEGMTKAGLNFKSHGGRINA